MGNFGRISSIALAAAVLCLSPLGGQASANTEAAAGPSPERLALLARGINLNSWFTTWADPATYGTRLRPDEAVFLKKAGFTVCRLPLAPGLLFDPAKPAEPKETISYVDSAVHMLLDAGLAVVFDPIHGPSSNADWERGLDRDPTFLAKVEIYWEALARHYAHSRATVSSSR